MFEFVTRLFAPPKQKPKTCTIEGYWCRTPISPDARATTLPIGKVNEVTVMVDVEYLVVGEEVKLQSVRLSRKNPNVAAVKRSETWQATTICADSVLISAVSADLADPEGYLRKAMLARWRDTFGKPRPPDKRAS